MISTTLTKMPQVRADAITLWLHKTEAEEFIASVKGELAAYISEAMGKSVGEHPERLFSDTNKMSPDAERLLRKAARLKIFLDVLADKRSPDVEFTVANLKLD